jgi:hypothetical protein
MTQAVFNLVVDLAGSYEGKTHLGSKGCARRLGITQAEAKSILKDLEKSGLFDITHEPNPFTPEQLSWGHDPQDKHAPTCRFFNLKSGVDYLKGYTYLTTGRWS